MYLKQGMLKKNNGFNGIHYKEKKILEKVYFSFGKDEFSLRNAKNERSKSEVHGRLWLKKKKIDERMVRILTCTLNHSY